MESSEVPLPKSMVAADLQRALGGFAARTGRTPEQLAAAIEAGGGSMGEAIEDLRPSVERGVRHSLVRRRSPTRRGSRSATTISPAA